MAQDTADMAEECSVLVRLTEENADRFEDDWIESANAVAQANVAEDCAAWNEQADIALAEAESEGADTGSRIVVNQPEPQVSVEQSAPEIAVDQPQPQVTVDQGQPEIIVEQAEPTVTVDVPQPTVTIDQPEPNITVRMPEPEVTVTMPDPEIAVSQDQPEVSVSQEQPEVEVQVEEPEVNVEDQAGADVQVEQEQAVVTREDDEGQPDVSIERDEPAISYEGAEPNVEVNSEGEANVQFTESGEPNVNVEEQTDAASNDEVEEAAETAADEAAADEAATDTDANAEQAANVETFPAESFIDRMVVTENQEDVGTIEYLVTDGADTYAVFTQGGFFGLGANEASVPVSYLSVEPGGEYLILEGMTEEELDALPELDLAATQQVPADQPIELSVY